jgi:hypothetical protein
MIQKLQAPGDEALSRVLHDNRITDSISTDDSTLHGPSQRSRRDRISFYCDYVNRLGSPDEFASWRAHNVIG